jgi:hypothetical protein
MESRSQRRANERAFKKLKHTLVCMWCGTSGKNCTGDDPKKVTCNECKDNTRLIKKKFYDELNK